MVQQGKCEIHGIWLDVNGRCHFCDTKNAQVTRGEGVKIVGGGEKKGVRVMSKDDK